MALESLDTGADSAEVQVTAPQTKGGLNVKQRLSIDPKGTENILAEMQRLVDEREGPMAQFMGGLNRAYATTYGPDVASREAKRQADEQAQTMGYKQSIAAFRAAQKQAEADKAYYGGPAGGEGAGVPGMPTVGGTRLDQILAGLSPEQRAIAEDYARHGDYDEIRKLVQAEALKRPDLVRNLEAIRRLPPGPERDMLMNQAFEKSTFRKVGLPTGGTMDYTPSYALPPELGGAPAGGDAAQWAQQNGIPVSPQGGTRTTAQQTEQFVKNPSLAAVPGTSPHEAGRALDIPVAKQTPEVIAKLRAAGFTNPYPNEPWHWERAGVPVSTARAEIAAGPKSTQGQITVPGYDPRSSQSKEALQKIAGERNKFFEDSTQKRMADRQVTDVTMVDDVNRNLELLNKTKVGPGTDFGKTMLEFKGAISGLSPKEQERLYSLKTLDQTSKNITLSGVKSKLAGSTSDSDLKYLTDAMFSINDPKKFIKATLEATKASAVLNSEILRYVNKPENAFRKQEAYDEFLDPKNGMVRAILQREAPTAFGSGEKAKPAATSSTAAAVPKDIDAALKARGITPEEGYEYRIGPDGSIQRKKK